MAEGGLTRGRRQQDQNGFARFARNAAGFLWQGVSAEDVQGVKDLEKAERGARLARLVALEAPPDIWVDQWTMLQEEFDEGIEAVLALLDGEVTFDRLLAACWKMKAVQRLATKHDAGIVIGHAAMGRLAKKRLASSMAATETKEKRDATAG